MARRAKISFVVDCIALVAFVVLVTTGILMRYQLPPGSHGLSVWGWGRHDWGGLHFWVAALFLASVALHLWLHWRWIAALVQGRRQAARRGRAILATLILAVVLAAAAAPLFSQVIVEGGRGEHAGEGHGRGAGRGRRALESADREHNGH